MLLTVTNSLACVIVVGEYKFPPGQSEHEVESYEEFANMKSMKRQSAWLTVSPPSVKSEVAEDLEESIQGLSVAKSLPIINRQTDIDLLETWLLEEQDGQNRKTIIECIELQIEQVADVS